MSTGPGLIRIMIVDDHPLLRQGIAALLKTSAGYGTGSRGVRRGDGHRAISSAPPDVTLDGSANAKCERE